MRRLLPLLLVLVGAAPVRAAAPPLRHLGAATGSVFSDGHGLVAYQPSGDVVRVVDRRVRQVALVRSPPGCALTAFGSHTLLWDCQGSGELMNVRTRHRARIGPVPGGGGTFAQWTGVGAHWLVGTVHVPSGGGDEFVSRSTGEVRDTAPLADRRVEADLDSVGLWRHMCAPLHAGRPSPQPFVVEPQRSPFVFRPPLAAGIDRDHGDHERLIWGHCGRPMRVLWSCVTGCYAPDVGDHAVAWIDPLAGHLGVLLTDRRTVFGWRVTYPTSVALAGRRVFAQINGEVWTARLPPVRH